MSQGLLELNRHKTWANLRLIEYCERLDEAVLDSSIPGTYGSIRDTLRHIVDADEGYLSQLTRDAFRTRDEASAYVRPDPIPEGRIPLAELAARVRRHAAEWEAIAADAERLAGDITTTDGFRVPATVPMAQAIHHAGDHRSHVMSIIGALGLELPEPNGLDLWGYAEETGRLVELEPS